MRAISLLCLITILLARQSPASAQRFGLWSNNESLRLVRHDLQLEVAHPVAEIVLTQEFDNPHPFNLEATFTYPVPAGAVVTGLALWVKDERRPARLLERKQAQEIYDGIVREKRDPALLERLDGNTFRIRIFPVLARSRARIELRFAQLVEPAADHGYRVVLRRPPGAPVQALRLGVNLRAPFLPEAVRLEGFPGALRRKGIGWSLPATAMTRSFNSDVKLLYRAPASFRGPAVATATLPGQQVFVAEVPLSPGRLRDQSLVVLIDSSSSMEATLPQVRHLLQELLQRLSAADKMALVPFGLLPAAPQVQLLAADAEQKSRWRGQLNQLHSSGGASFLPAWRAALAAHPRHVVLITDGGSSYHAEELELLLREIVDGGGLLVSTVAVSGAANEEQLQAIAREGGGLTARLDQVQELPALAQRLLETRPAPGVQLEKQGKVRLINQAPGRLLVAGSLPEREADSSAGQPRDNGAERSRRPSSVLLRLHTGESFWLPLAEDQQEAAAVSALYGAAAIEEKMRQVRLFGETPELRREVVRLSLLHHVVSEYTALLATETDADYQRPTSGERWQRRLPNARDDLDTSTSQFQSTPEPHEIVLLTLALLVLAGRSITPGRRKRESTPASSISSSR